ncbi:MAG: sigma-54-dependent Fis family transcriptional regulator [Phycisphaeraceae bacterium]|nr:sigma-54-dependent Fis family transcriptional regulator [Phycisphaeraceae bacterium]
MARILVIEDEANLRHSIRQTLKRAGHEIVEADSVPAAQSAMRTAAFDLILTDVHLGAGDGLEFLREVRTDGFDGVVVVMTAYGSIESAVQAVRDGADDYLQKPLSMEELQLQVGLWLNRRRQVTRLRLYERMERSREGDQEILGSSPAWTRTLGIAEKLAAIPLTAGADRDSAGLPAILLLGETGVGKGVLAKYIHDCAVKASRGPGGGDVPPMVHVNCSALPATLVEGELFGHEKGAFTDAREAKAGLFEMADGGTIFLDEVSEMPLELQAKLLLAVEQGVFRRVGGTRERRVTLRVIAASNQDLARRAQDGAFRRDLFYRLSTFTLDIPPLRERGEDAIVLAGALAERFAKRYGRPALRLGASAEDAIRRHAWPGNVRELVNAVQRAAMLAPSDEITSADLALAGAPSARSLIGANGTHPAPGALRFDFENGPHTAEDVEKELMRQALRFTRGNVSRAAKLIGMQRSSFRYRIDRYRLESFVREIAQR